jgi:hypothetical protein
VRRSECSAKKAWRTLGFVRIPEIGGAKPRTRRGNMRTNNVDLIMRNMVAFVESIKISVGISFEKVLYDAKSYGTCGTIPTAS